MRILKTRAVRIEVINQRPMSKRALINTRYVNAKMSLKTIELHIARQFIIDLTCSGGGGEGGR
jgi:hypothetical protein